MYGVEWELVFALIGALDSSQIVDSVIALFRVDFSGRGELAERQVYVLALDYRWCLR